MGMGKRWKMALKLHDDAEMMCHKYRNLLHTHSLKLDNSMPKIATTSGFCGKDQYPDLPCGSTSGLRIWDDWIPGLVFLKGSPTSQWSILISSVEIVILGFFRYSGIPNI